MLDRFSGWWSDSSTWQRPKRLHVLAPGSARVWLNFGYADGRNVAVEYNWLEGQYNCAGVGG